MMKTLRWHVFLFVLISLLSSSVLMAQVEIVNETVVIMPGELGVVVDLTNGELIDPLQAGSHTYNREEQQVIVFNTRPQAAFDPETSVIARTLDGVEAFIDVDVRFSIEADQINAIYSRWGEDYLANYIQPTLRSAVREDTVNFTAEQIYSTAYDEWGFGLFTKVQGLFAEEGFRLDSLSVFATFSEEYTLALADKQIAEQNQAAALLEAETLRAEAEESARTAIIEAEGNAQALLIEAQARFESLQLVAPLIESVPALILYDYVQVLRENGVFEVLPMQNPFALELPENPND